MHVVGLNFRDVLNVLGEYPGDPGPPGPTRIGATVRKSWAADKVQVYGVSDSRSPQIYQISSKC